MFMRSFQQAFGSYPQHLDIDLLHPLAADGSIPSGKDVSLFVGKNGEVLVYAKPPAPGGTGAFRGIYGLDGAPNGKGSTGMDFFADGTPHPVSILPHATTPNDPTGGIDVTLADGSKEHWWQAPSTVSSAPGQDNLIPSIIMILPRRDWDTFQGARCHRASLPRPKTVLGRHHPKTSRGLHRINRRRAQLIARPVI
jgi:hypothetical protein